MTSFVTSATHPCVSRPSAPREAWFRPPVTTGAAAVDGTSIDRVARTRDLTYALAMVEAAERLLAQPDLLSVLTAAATEALTVIGADHASVTRLVGIRRCVLDVHPARNAGRAESDLLWAAGRDPWLTTPGTIDDLLRDPRWESRATTLASAPWRSVMTVQLTGRHPQEQVRLSWVSNVPGAFADHADIADLFARHANQAISFVSEREDSRRESRDIKQVFDDDLVAGGLEHPPLPGLEGVRPTPRDHWSGSHSDTAVALGHGLGTGLTAELLDGITDAVLSSTSPLARADTVRALVQEVYASLAWLKGDLDDGELSSLHTIVDAATAHAHAATRQASIATTRVSS